MDALLESVANKIKAHPKLVIADDFEIALQRSVTTQSVYSNGLHNSQSEHDRFWISLRVLHRKRGGRAVVTDSSPASLAGLVEAAFDSASRAAVDPWFRFPIWKSTFAQAALPSEEPNTGTALFDTVADDGSFLEETYRTEKVDTLLRRKMERVELRHRRLGHQFAFSLLTRAGKQALVRKEERAYSPSKADHETSLARLIAGAQEWSRADVEATARGKMAVVFAPRVVARLLATMAPWFSADRVQLGMNPLGAQPGDSVFSPVLTLIDDGTANGAASFDLEGASTQRTVLVENGQLKSWLYDVYSATRDNRLSTGSFLRRLGEAHPNTQPALLKLEPGKYSQSELFNLMGNGIYFNRLDIFEPLSQADGRWFLRGSGWRIEKGQRIAAVAKLETVVRMSELFRKAAGVGNDLKFFCGQASPSIFFEEIPLGS